jgi:hypothetical protein
VLCELFWVVSVARVGASTTGFPSRSVPSRPRSTHIWGQVCG